VTLPRLYLPRTLEKGDLCLATADQARYLKTVLRLREGDPVLIFNGTGREYDAIIRRHTAERVELEVTGSRFHEADRIRVTLCQAVPKVEKMDGIIRRATELGVARIIPFFAERSVPRWRPEQYPHKQERWQKIAVEASRQCGRTDIAKISEILTFEQMLSAVPESGLRLIPWEEETVRGIREVLRDPDRNNPTEFTVVIGPEGGFSVDEIEKARKAGFVSVSLGKRVLRVETASVAVLAMIRYETDSRETEEPR